MTKCTCEPISTHLHFSGKKYIAVTENEHRRIHELPEKFLTNCSRGSGKTFACQQMMEQMRQKLLLAEQNKPVKVQFT